MGFFSQIIQDARPPVAQGAPAAGAAPHDRVAGAGQETPGDALPPGPGDTLFAESGNTLDMATAAADPAPATPPPVTTAGPGATAPTPARIQPEVHASSPSVEAASQPSQSATESHAAPGADAVESAPPARGGPAVVSEQDRPLPVTDAGGSAAVAAPPLLEDTAGNPAGGDGRAPAIPTPAMRTTVPVPGAAHVLPRRRRDHATDASDTRASVPVPDALTMGTATVQAGPAQTPATPPPVRVTAAKAAAPLDGGAGDAYRNDQQRAPAVAAAGEVETPSLPRERASPEQQRRPVPRRPRATSGELHDPATSEQMPPPKSTLADEDDSATTARAPEAAPAQADAHAEPPPRVTPAQAPHSEPTLYIGHIDVIVEAPPPAPTATSAAPPSDLASRHYLRRL